MTRAMLPLTGTFTLVILAHARDYHFLRSQAIPSGAVGVLTDDIPIESVTKKFGFTLEHLKVLNFFRGFHHMKGGDEPGVSELSARNSEAMSGLPSVHTDPEPDEGAEITLRAGSFLAHSPGDSATPDMAIASIANDEVTHWLSQAGTPHMPADTDVKFSVNTAVLDLRFSVPEGKNALINLPSSIRRIDHRFQSTPALVNDRAGLNMRLNPVAGVATQVIFNPVRYEIYPASPRNRDNHCSGGAQFTRSERPAGTTAKASGEFRGKQGSTQNTDWPSWRRVFTDNGIKGHLNLSNSYVCSN